MEDVLDREIYDETATNQQYNPFSCCINKKSWPKYNSFLLNLRITGDFILFSVFSLNSTALSLIILDYSWWNINTHNTL